MDRTQQRSGVRTLRAGRRVGPVSQQLDLIALAAATAAALTRVPSSTLRVDVGQGRLGRCGRCGRLGRSTESRRSDVGGAVCTAADWSDPVAAASGLRTRLGARLQSGADFRQRLADLVDLIVIDVHGQLRDGRVSLARRWFDPELGTRYAVLGRQEPHSGVQRPTLRKQTCDRFGHLSSGSKDRALPERVL